MFDQDLNFPCPSCKEIISERMLNCKFCAAPVDRGIARMLGERQQQVNQAYSDATYIKSAAVVMWGFLGVSVIPLVPLVDWGFLATFILVIAMIIRWQLRFNNIVTSDTDYLKAKRAKNLALVLWVVAIPVGFFVAPLVEEAIKLPLW
jgi:hypothetical protein